MPVMTGNHLVRKILAIKPDIPVISYTGYSDCINAEKAETIGIQHYIVKTVNQRQSAEMVKAMLDTCNGQELNDDSGWLLNRR